MNTSSLFSQFHGKVARSRVPALVAGFFATVISLPAAAANPIDYPNVPLQSGSTVPPNIMFILDDSGSMASDFMPRPGAASDSAPATSTAGGKPNIGRYTAALNGIYYNPATDYQPWRKADKSLYADPGPTAASDNDTSLADPIDLTANIQTYYVPTANGLDLNDAENYYRYQILTDGRVIRAELSAAGTPTPVVLPVATGVSANNGNYSTTYFVVVPAGTTNLTITSSGGTLTGTRGADLFVRLNNQPTTGTYTCRSITNGNNESCVLNNPAAGTYQIRLYAQGGNFNNVSIFQSQTKYSVDSNNCDLGSPTGWDWSNCAVTTPNKNALVVPAIPASSRSPGAELDNYATWYTFYRTRNKTAKAGASQAFSDLGENLRVGFRTIWGRNTFNIPVGSDGGLFRDTVSPASSNRTTWFNRLFGAIASSNTPLQGALQSAGEYYKNSASTGPYGPESGSAQLACRQNFAILTTDGFWNSQSNFNSGTVLNSDDTDGVSIPLGAGAPPATPYQYIAARPFKDSWSATLADVAMQYWKEDLRTDLDNKVPVSADDPGYWQHMTTFGISIGLQGTLDPKTDLPALTAGTKVWPSPLVAENATRIDDLFHASVNGHGEFVAATNSNEFSEGLKAALAAIGRRLASGSSVATTGPRIASGSKVFAASYFSGSWNGDVAAYSITPSGISTSPVWTASAQMPLVGARKIFSFNGSNGIPFTWASLTAAQKTALGSQTLFDYIRGDRSGETGPTPLRVRDSLIGDIVNSSPEYLQEAATTLPTTLPAVDTVFVGANDGMLHAFNGTTGAEQFAYVPGGISFGDLKALSVPSYAHYFFVDGPLVVSRRSQTPGKNVLVGALGRGGHGVFALDVSNPAGFNQSKVLWERSNDAEMGNVLGKPIIAKLNNGVDAVIVPNGINGSSNLPALFVFDLANGNLIKKLNITNATYGSATSPNGLSAPRGWDANSDGTIDLVYAGDLLGNVWKFDLSNAAPGLWSAPTAPLFTAKDSANKPQPITGGLSIALDPTTFETWLFFGTGRFLTGNDLSNNDVQTWYGIKDVGTPIASRAALRQRQVIYYQAAVPAVIGPPAVAAKPALRVFGPAGVGDMVGKSGWYLDLVNPPYGAAQKIGERMVFDPILVGGTVLVEASQSPSDDPCTPGGGGFVNAVDAFSGGSVLAPFFDSNGDGLITAADKVGVAGTDYPPGSIDPGVGMPSTPVQVGNVLLIGGSSVNKPSRLPIADTRVTGRISWREILRD